MPSISGPRSSAASSFTVTPFVSGAARSFVIIVSFLHVLSACILIIQTDNILLLWSISTLYHYITPESNISDGAILSKIKKTLNQIDDGIHIIHEWGGWVQPPFAPTHIRNESKKRSPGWEHAF
jgi:hypothetical protein